MNNIPSLDPILYTTSFKAYHLEIEAPSIQLSESAWIERSLEYSHEPTGFQPSLLFFSDDPQFGLSRFWQDLLASPIRLRTFHSAKEAEDNPFQLQNCSHVAIAAAILCAEWFVVGIESFANSRDSENPSIGPPHTER